MAAKAEDYRRLLAALLPQGLIWPRDAESNLGRLLHSLAEELARIDARGGDLINEADPRTAFELLSQWEKVCGLPDECSALSETLAARRGAVLAKLTALGGQTPDYFIELAATLGYQIGIYEFQPCRAGMARAGDPCGGDDWAHAFRVEGPETSVFVFRAGQSQAGDNLRTWGNEKLECTIETHKPAHSTVLFAYGE